MASSTMDSQELVDLYYRKSDAAYTFFSGKISREEFDSLMVDIKYLAYLNSLLTDDTDGLFADISLADLLKSRTAPGCIALPPL